MCGVSSSLFFRIPALANVSAILFPVMPECARALCIWIVCGV
jgi:hypothetical protein